MLASVFSLGVMTTPSCTGATNCTLNRGFRITDEIEIWVMLVVYCCCCFYKTEGYKLRFQKHLHTCGRGLSDMKLPRVAGDMFHNKIRSDV